jgi:hypothetical protein
VHHEKPKIYVYGLPWGPDNLHEECVAITDDTTGEIYLFANDDIESILVVLAGIWYDRTDATMHVAASGRSRQDSPRWAIRWPIYYGLPWAPQVYYRATD